MGALTLRLGTGQCMQRGGMLPKQQTHQPQGHAAYAIHTHLTPSLPQALTTASEVPPTMAEQLAARIQALELASADSNSMCRPALIDRLPISKSPEYGEYLALLGAPAVQSILKLIGEITIGIEEEVALNSNAHIELMQSTAKKYGSKVVEDESIKCLKSQHPMELVSPILRNAQTIKAYITLHAKIAANPDLQCFKNTSMGTHVHIGFRQLSTCSKMQLNIAKQFIYIFAYAYNCLGLRKATTYDKVYSPPNPIFNQEMSEIESQLKSIATLPKLIAHLHPNTNSDEQPCRKQLLNMLAIAKHGTIEIRGLCKHSDKDAPVRYAKGEAHHYDPLHGLNIANLCQIMMDMAMKKRFFHTTGAPECQLFNLTRNQLTELQTAIGYIDASIPQNIQAIADPLNHFYHNPQAAGGQSSLQGYGYFTQSQSQQGSHSAASQTLFGSSLLSAYQLPTPPNAFAYSTHIRTASNSASTSNSTPQILGVPQPPRGNQGRLSRRFNLQTQ